MTSISASSPHVTASVSPEVWLRIFGFATALEALLSCDASASSDLPRSLVRQHESHLLKESLCTKRSMALVCRAWNQLALEYLYQSILITKVDNLVSLHESLQRHVLLAQGKNRLGWWTKRFDVFIQDERCEASIYNILAAVVRQLPNLSIIAFSIPTLQWNDCWFRQLPSSVILSLAGTCGASLQVFDCSESILRPCREDLMMLLAACPNLKVLKCPICSPTPAERAFKTRLDIPIMSKLESITLVSVFLRDYLPRDKDVNHLPALRHITYDCTPPPFFDRTWKNFVKLTCANLTSVTLDSCLAGDSLQNEFDLLSECCMALDKLTIFLHTWLELKQRLVLPPVSYLGLHSKVPKGPPSHYHALFSALATITAHRLRTVRLLHATTAEELRENISISSSAAEESAMLASCSFSLEDREGNILLH